MQTLNFDRKFHDLDGSERLENMAQELALVLQLKTPGIEATKAMDWARELHDKKTLTLDKTDKDKLERFIMDHSGMANLAVTQLLAVCKEN